MVTNSTMAKLWTILQIDALTRSSVMDSPLARLAEAPLIGLPDSTIVLEPFVDSVRRSELENDTEFEALANKIHVVDYLEKEHEFPETVCQGVLYCRRLAIRLTELAVSSCVALTVDPEPGVVIARFFRRRTGEEWFAPDLNAFQEGIALWLS